MGKKEAYGMIDMYSDHTRHVPHQYLLVPAAARAPSFGAEQTPIHAHGEFSMPPHSPQFSPSSHYHSSCAADTANIPVDDLGVVEFGASAAAAAVGPDPACHVIAGAQEHVAHVGAPGQLADGVVVAGQDGEGALGKACSDVEGADLSVDARGGDDRAAVFVPVVGQGFRRGDGLRGVMGRVRDAGWGRVQGDGEDEVVRRRGGGAQIEDSEVGVG